MERRRLKGEPVVRNAGLHVNPIGNKRPSGGEAWNEVLLLKSSKKRPRKSSNG